MKANSAPTTVTVWVVALLSLGGVFAQSDQNQDKPSEQSLKLDGLVLNYPPEWKSMPVPDGGPMAPKAIIQIPNENGEPGSIRITHFPRMKGMNEANIERWLAQTKNADGSPATKGDAKIETKKIEGIELTIVDLSGSIKATMRDAAKPNQRMIAAIIDHAKGPHFVVAVGDDTLITKSEKAIRAFYESARVAP